MFETNVLINDFPSLQFPHRSFPLTGCFGHTTVSVVDPLNHPDVNVTEAKPVLVYAKFESQLQVRPDDIDMYKHVHSSRYMDYVLAARFDQMERCYDMPMAEFQKLGYGWVIAATQMNFRRPLVLGDKMVVRCWIEKFSLIGLRLQFEIDRQADGKRASDGWFDYVMVSVETGRPVRIPDSIRQKYSI